MTILHIELRLKNIFRMRIFWSLIWNIEFVTEFNVISMETNDWF